MSCLLAVVSALLVFATSVRSEVFFIDAIVPAPQAVEYGRWIVFKDTPSRPLVVRVHVSEVPENLELAAVESIRERLDALGRGDIEIDLVQGRRFEVETQTAHLSIHLGTMRNSELADFYDRLALLPIPKAEGYRIRTVMGAQGRPGVWMLGSDLRGAFYAVQSFSQMMTLRDGYLAIRELQVDDWPSFGSRASGNDEKPPSPDLAAEAVEWFARFKLNGWPLGQSYHWPEDWRETPDSAFRVIRRASTLPVSDAVDLRFQIHPFGRSADDTKRYTIRVASSMDRQIFIETIRKALLAGASEVLIRADDFHDLSDVDQRAYASKAEAHAAIVNEAYSVLRLEFPDADFYFCPPYYTGQESQEAGDKRTYMEQIGELLPQEIDILWTGPEVISNAFTASQQLEFSELIGRPAYLWDNTIYQEKSSFGYRYDYSSFFLEEMDTRFPEGFADLTPGVRFNFGYDGTWINRIGNIVLADYLWNPRAFDPELSLRRATAICVGPAAVEPYLEAIRQLRLIWDLRHSPARWALQPIPSSDSFRNNMRRLESTALNEAAVSELQRRWSDFSGVVEQLSQLSNHFEGLGHKGSFVLYPDAGGWTQDFRGDWSSGSSGGLMDFDFPYETKGEAGSFAAQSIVIDVPENSKGRYFLHFVFDDAYRAKGGPPASYPGYFFKQILIDGEIVWEEDTEGLEPINPTTIEVSRYLRGKYRVEITARCIDKKGVYNLGIQASLSPIFITSH